jgi:hypothetical protein
MSVGLCVIVHIRLTLACLPSRYASFPAHTADDRHLGQTWPTTQTTQTT